MDIIDNLTNEEISKRFNNQFDLVNYAIGLATNMIQTGRDPRVKMNTENPALLILEEIAEGKDEFVEVPKKEVVKKYEEVAVHVKETMIIEDETDETFEEEEEEETQEVLSD